MDKPRIIAANWKANLNYSQALELADGYLEKVVFQSRQEIIVFPSALHFHMLYRKFENTPFKLGAQNMHWEKKGAYTGEICADQLTDYAVGYILLAHSERRHYFQETYEVVNKKLRLALDLGLKPVLCVGESLPEKEAGITEMVIVDQLESALLDVNKEAARNIIITYEPIWAIGTGKPVPIKKSEHVIEIIRKSLGNHFNDEELGSLPVLYGGSVDPNQAENYMHCPEIDGVLVGGASLNPEKFAKIAHCATD